MNVMRKRLISLNLAILMLLSLVLPAGAAELGEPAAVLTAEQSVAQTGEPVVQGLVDTGANTGTNTGTKIMATFVDQTGKTLATVDASADGWEPPALPSTLGGGQNLYWFGSFYTIDGAKYQPVQCFPGVGYPALPTTLEFRPVQSESTRGILFCDNGMLDWTDSNRFMMKPLEDADTGEMGITWYALPSLNGRSFLGWTLASEDDGKYLNGKDLVPGTDTGWVTLYAQWTPEGKTAVYLDDEFYGFTTVGRIYTLPQLAGDANYRLSGWRVSYETNNNYDFLQPEQTVDGWQVYVPAGTMKLRIYPEYQFVGKAVIDGSTYQFSEDRMNFHGTTWNLQSDLDGTVILTLNGYHGGEIQIPTKNLIVDLYGDNSITGGDNGTALYCAGELRFKQHCEENRHSSLVVTAGIGQNAISAKRIELAAHLMLTGGESATALASGTELLGTGAYNLYDGSNIELTEGYTNTSSLKIEPIIITVTIDGGGGTTADGKATLVLETEYGIVPDVETLFHWNGHMHVGHGGKYSYDSETGKINGSTITLEWVEVKYEHFVGFNTVDAVLETPDYERYLFRDNSQTVIAPKVTYLDAINKVLAYWKNQDDKTGTVRQYLPGEQVTEPDGTKFYAVTIRPDAQLLLVSNDLTSDGKTFDERGTRIRVSDGAYRLSAADGSQLLSWNTQADGKGTAYAPNTEIDLSGRTAPLVLYAQWLQKGEIKVTIDMGNGSCAKSAKPGTRYELPEMLSSTEDRAFDHWSAYYRTKDGEYPDLEVKQDANGNWYVDIPADAAGVTCSAYFLPTGTFNIGGALCKFERPDQVFKDENGKWTLHFEWRSNGCVVLRLYGYHGGMINLQLAEAAIEVYEDSTITTTDDVPALQAYGTLWLVTLCGEDKHPTLTVTGSDGQSAIDAAEVTFNSPHIVVTTQGAKAVEGEVNWASNLCALRGGTSADNARALKWKEAQAEDLTYLKTDPLFSDVTFRGNGGKATDGSGKETLVKTYENGIYAKNLDRLFKKDGALYAGYAVGGRHHTGNSLYINGDGTVDILWAESGYSNFVGFHTEGAIKEKLDYDFGWGAGYLFRDNSKTVIAPTITYQDPVSNGNLVYWYVSDDGEGSANAKQYLPGDVVKEESGTELYPASVYANWNIAFMSNGKTFEDGRRALITDRCPAEMKATDGTELIGWNTKKDGSGQAYAPGSKPDLTGRTEPLVLYAHWKKPVYVAKVEEPKPNEPQTGGTLTIKPRPTPAPDPGTGTGPEPTEPEKPAPITEKQKVLVGVYRWGMMIAVLQGETDKKGEEIYCTVPKGLNLTGCALKLFVLSEAYAPDRKVEFILLSE